jgi:hypothetical protein
MAPIAKAADTAAAMSIQKENPLGSSALEPSGTALSLAVFELELVLLLPLPSLAESVE